MNNNKISNPKKEVPTGLALIDQDYMTILLCHFKELEKNLTVALTEASNQKLYKELKKMFDSIANTQRLAYELMFNYGWYSLEKAKDTKIKTLENELQTKIDNLN